MIANKSESSGTIMDIPVTASSTFMEHALNAPLYLNYGIDLAHHRADRDSLACAAILIRYMEAGADPTRYVRNYRME